MVPEVLPEALLEEQPDLEVALVVDQQVALEEMQLPKLAVAAVDQELLMELPELQLEKDLVAVVEQLLEVVQLLQAVVAEVVQPL